MAKVTVLFLAFCCNPCFSCAGVLKKGAAKSGDHNNMGHAFWWQATMKRMDIRVERVGSKENIADDPSRGEFCSLTLMNGEYKQPSIPDASWNSVSWQPRRCEFMDLE